MFQSFQSSKSIPEFQSMLLLRSEGSFPTFMPRMKYTRAWWMRRRLWRRLKLMSRRWRGFFDNVPSFVELRQRPSCGRELRDSSTARTAQEVLTLEEEESAVDATEEHDDDAHQRVETPINIVSQYLP